MKVFLISLFVIGSIFGCYVVIVLDDIDDMFGTDHMPKITVQYVSRKSNLILPNDSVMLEVYDNRDYFGYSGWAAFLKTDLKHKQALVFQVSKQNLSTLEHTNNWKSHGTASMDKKIREVGETVIYRDYSYGYNRLAVNIQNDGEYLYIVLKSVYNGSLQANPQEEQM